ncbi:MAG: hypothetical protein N5P05_001160 [Chroococcopsis gigantea SAG 12.99]|jgi:hypothetical protein|nr:hypothetical protein [Chroococcopsis gigantea SAG 12.99]
MLFFVIGFNFGLTLLNCYLVWRLWQLRLFLSRLTKTLICLEARIDKTLLPAPELVMALAENTSNLKRNYYLLDKGLESLQPVFLVVRLSRLYWRKLKRF